ncbi:hypothetical protein [Methylorubrum aminovorans]|uniref:hypothetical protein n=1 Tax=Methylorubrum aminovorans TaxID=269069 RepID=UPI003C2FAC2B
MSDLMAAELARSIAHAGFKGYSGHVALLKPRPTRPAPGGDLTQSAHLSQEISDLAKAMGAAMRASRCPPAQSLP